MAASSALYSPPSPLKSTMESPTCKRRTRTCRTTSSGSCTMSSGERDVPTKKRGIRKILISSRKVASERPTVAVQILDLGEAVAPELVLWLAQRFCPGGERPGVNRVDIVDIDIKRLRRNRACASRCFRGRAERAFRREHHDQLALIRHLDVHDGAVVLHAVPQLEAERRGVERGRGTRVAHRQTGGQPGHTGWAGGGHGVLRIYGLLGACSEAGSESRIVCL